MIDEKLLVRTELGEVGVVVAVLGTDYIDARLMVMPMMSWAKADDGPGGLITPFFYLYMDCGSILPSEIPNQKAHLLNIFGAACWDNSLSIGPKAPLGRMFLFSPFSALGLSRDEIALEMAIVEARKFPERYLDTVEKTVNMALPEYENSRDSLNYLIKASLSQVWIDRAQYADGLPSYVGRI